MAVGSTFKQKCPSCEAMVSVQATLIGKKVECSKCKYRFIVEDPVEKDRAAVAAGRAEVEDVDVLDEVETSGKHENGAKNGNGVKNGAGARTKEDAEAKPKKRFRDEDLEEKSDKTSPNKPAKKRRDEDDEPAAKTAPGKGKKKKRDDDDEEKPSGAPIKLLLGLGLGVIGFIVLAIVAWLIFFPPGGGGGGGGGQPVVQPKGPANPPVAEGKKEDKKDDKKDDKAPVVLASGAGPEQTNLFPESTEHILHVFMKDVFEPGSPLRDAVFNAQGGLGGTPFKKRLGFELTDVSDLIRGERYSGQGWSMSVLFLSEPIDEAAVIAALALKPEPQIKDYTYYRATRANPTFDQLARFTFGVPQSLRLVATRAQRPLYVRFHNPQTLIVADEEPLKQLLLADNRLPEKTERPKAGGGFNPPIGQPGPGGSGFPGPGGPGSGGPDSGGLKPMTPGAGGGAPDRPGRGGKPGGPGGQSSLDPRGAPNSPGIGETDGFSIILAAQGGPMPMPGGGGPMPGGGSGGPIAGGSGGPPMPGAGTPFPGGGGPPAGAGSGFPGPGGPGGQQGRPAPPPLNPRDEMYLTLKPGMKNMLDRMEVHPEGAKVLFSSVTDLMSAKIETNLPEFKNQIIRVPRELWDITYLITEDGNKTAGMGLLGTALIQREARNFQLHNELVCTQEAHAKDFHKQLIDTGCPTVVRFFEKLFDHKIELPKVQEAPSNNLGPGGFPIGPGGLGGPMGGGPGIPGTGAPAQPTGPFGGPQGPTQPGGGRPGGPGGTGAFPGSGFPGPGGPGFQGPGGNNPKKEEVTVSQITLDRFDKVISFKLDLVMDNAAFSRVLGVASFAAGSLRSEMDLAGYRLQHALAKAAKDQVEKGLSEANVPPGQYVPGAFPPTNFTTRQGLEPRNRISFLAGLLPYMGHEGLYSKISFKNNWRDPANWLAGRSVIPQFLDPMYPDASRQVVVNGVPVDYAATHYVGIAGVGLDAANYDRNDPAYITKRGVFGYDKSASWSEIEKGRGTSNTIVMIQVPHDGAGGVSPWIAGGGATVRGVPEKNSIAPFVLGKDKYGNAIQHNGKKGTYAMMADGSVRFISENVSDDVFKAMATIQGAPPADFDLDKNPQTPRVDPKELNKDEPKVEDVSPESPSGVKLPPGWVLYTSPDGYSVGFPKQPTPQSKDYPELGTVKGVIAENNAKKLAFEVETATLNPQLQEKAKTLEGLREIAMMTAPPDLKQLIKITKEAPVTAGSVKGLELHAKVDLGDKGSLIAIVRLFVVKDRYYSVAVMAANSAPPETAMFFDSFRIGADAVPVTQPPPKTDGGLPAVKVPQGWVEYKSPDGLFAVAVPKQPMGQTLNIPGAGPVTIQLVQLPSGKGLLNITAKKVPAVALEMIKQPGALRKAAEIALAATSKDTLKITGDKPVKSGAYSGIELAIEGNAVAPGGQMIPVTVRSRVFLVEDSTISLEATGFGNTAPPETDAFFNSLVIRSGPPQKAPSAPVQPPTDPPAKGDLGQPAAVVPPGWVTFKAPDGSFTAAMPLQPVELTKKTAEGDMKKFVSKLGSNAELTAGTVPISADDVAKNGPDQLFTSITFGLGLSGGKISGERKVTLGKYEGREFQVSLESPNGVTVVYFVRLYLVGNTCVIVQGPGEKNAPSAATTLFFNSLRLGN